MGPCQLRVELVLDARSGSVAALQVPEHVVAEPLAGGAADRALDQAIAGIVLVGGARDDAVEHDPVVRVGDLRDVADLVVDPIDQGCFGILPGEAPGLEDVGIDAYAWTCVRNRDRRDLLLSTLGLRLSCDNPPRAIIQHPR